MGKILKQETRERISMAQESVNLTTVEKKRSKLVAAISLIQNGEDWGRPDMKRRGLEIIAGLMFPEIEWGVLDTTLMGNRRDWFIKAIEEKNNESRQTPFNSQEA